MLITERANASERFRSPGGVIRQVFLLSKCYDSNELHTPDVARSVRATQLLKANYPSALVISHIRMTGITFERFLSISMFFHTPFMSILQPRCTFSPCRQRPQQQLAVHTEPAETTNTTFRKRG